VSSAISRASAETCRHAMIVDSMNLAFLPIPEEQVSMTCEVGSARDTPERIEDREPPSGKRGELAGKAAGSP